MEKEFDLLVFILRAQPFHLEHKRIIDIALEKSRNVLVLVGSAGKARTIRNPFTFDERQDMILQSYNPCDMHRLYVKPLYDKTYNDVAWINQVQHIVKETALDVANNGNTFRANGMGDMKIGLIGASKDAHTEYYLRMFPQWQSVDAGIETDLHATTIREDFLHSRQVSMNCPVNVRRFMMDFVSTDSYKQLHDELLFVTDYKKQWKAAPYPVKHMTVDAVVEQSGHILLVKRRSAPGKGLWALPGGHLEINETMEDGMIRELREETKIKVPEAVLRGSIHANRTFDDPYRSTIGRVITQAYHIKLVDDVKLPKVKGADDAEKAKWVPINELREEDFFDDHYFLICHFLSLW